MKPIISTSGKTTQLQYELPHRVHDTKIYPVKAPNGSTVILYGHETGVGILWRGGHPLKHAAPQKQVPKPPAKVNGTSNDAIMIIDSDSDEPAQSAPQLAPEAEFENEEEELDPDYPYQTIIQQLRLPLNTEVLHIAVPHVPTVSPLRPAESFPSIFNEKLVFVVACADYSVRIITLPLSPPSHAAKEARPNAKSQYGEEVVKIPTYVGHQSIPKGVTVTWTSRGEPNFNDDSEDEMDVDDEEDSLGTPRRRRARRKQSQSSSVTRNASEGWDLLVASYSAERGGLLKIWRFGISDTSLAVTNPVTAYQTLILKKSATRIVFNSALYPKRRHSQLLITDSSGTARIYDPFTPPSRKRRTGHSETGTFTALFRATFEDTRNSAPTPPVLSTRKSIIDATWASDGQSIVALLADGEWGVWDVTRSGPSPPADPSAFSLRGYLGFSDPERSSNGASSPRSRSGRGSLAPMTPNTRRKKEETLFHGGSTGSSGPVRGGLSVSSLTTANGGAPEDSVLIWYGIDIYRITDLAKFWSRTASNSSRASSGLTQVQGLPILGEYITSVQQFDTTGRAARLAIPRDALISAEHRLVISANTMEPLGRDLNAVFNKEQTEEEQTRKTDQALLAQGELDLGGMDRLLENLEGHGTGARGLTLGNPRKVLFASSTT